MSEAKPMTAAEVGRRWKELTEQQKNQLQEERDRLRALIERSLSAMKNDEGEVIPWIWPTPQAGYGWEPPAPCECGAEVAGIARHAFFCPAYKED